MANKLDHSRPADVVATVMIAMTISSAAMAQRGDMNCDGVFNNFDIDPFVQALADPAAWQAAHPGCDILNGDANGDGLVNNFDIDPFVACLINGCP